MSIKEVNDMVAADSEGRRSGDGAAAPLDELVAKADFVVADQRCPSSGSLNGFTLAPHSADLRLWLRNR